MKRQREPSAFELYDTSDVEFDMRDRKGKNEVILVARSASRFNLIKYYLALKEFTEKIERELDILENAHGEH